MKTRTSYQKDRKQGAILVLSLSLSLGSTFLATCPGLAQSKPKVIASASAGHPIKTVPRTDYFNVTTPPPTDASTAPARDPSYGAGGAMSMMSDRTPVVIWFEKFDDDRACHRPADADKIILARPINQDSERLAQWIAAAGRVAKTYTTFAGMLRKMAIPTGYPGLKEYRDLTADWYSDVAGVFVEMIRPRPPAKTIEQLQESLNEFKNRQNSLVATLTNLQGMDRSLREKYRVHLSIPDDPLQQYVRGK